MFSYKKTLQSARKPDRMGFSSGFFGLKNALSKPKPKAKGFLVTLDPEQRKKALAYRGDDTFGDPNFKK